eukprot:620936-Amphidinium_carterae.1
MALSSCPSCCDAARWDAGGASDHERDSPGRSPVIPCVCMFVKTGDKGISTLVAERVYLAGRKRG